MRSFFATSFCDLVLFFSFFFRLLILSCVFLLMSLVCSRAVIIVIREIYKFDDRPDNGASVQVYYRLSMCMQEASAKASQSRLASSRDKATVDRGIHNRNMFCVYIYVFFSLSRYYYFLISCRVLYLIVTFIRMFYIHI
jgi:hypothetical protein